MDRKHVEEDVLRVLARAWAEDQHEEWSLKGWRVERELCGMTAVPILLWPYSLRRVEFAVNVLAGSNQIEQGWFMVGDSPKKPRAVRGATEPERELNVPVEEDGVTLRPLVFYRITDAGRCRWADVRRRRVWLIGGRL